MDLNKMPENKRAFRPFNASCERFPILCRSTSVPGYLIE